MLKPGSIFIAFCMALVAASLAAILVVGLGMHLPMAIAGGIAGVTVIALVNKLVVQGGMARPATLRFFELEERIGLIAERVLTIEPRLMRIDQAAQDTARRTVEPIEKEVAELGTLVRSLAEQVQAHETALQELPARQAEWAVAELSRIPATELMRSTHAQIEEDFYADPVPTSATARMTTLDPTRAKQIRRAIETDGIELHLQPIASLPQRRVIQYSVLPYLRDDDGVLLPPADFLADARLAGLLPALDAFVVDRAIRIARRLKERDREIVLTVHLDAVTLSAPTFTQDIAKRLDSNADLATHLVIGFSQEALFGFGNVEAEILSSFGERSFRFALTGVHEPDLDGQALHTLGIRYMHMSSELLTNPELARNSDIHPADLPGLMRRHGILLIAEGTDTEAKVADLLDIDVRAARGAVFGLPRPVRPEIFTGEDSVKRPAVSPAAPERSAQQYRPFRSISRRA